MIELTIEELQARFVEYNHTYFNDELRMPIITLHHGRPYGEFKNKPRKTITLSEDVQWDDDSIKHVLIHEMIHCLNCQHGIYESFHGKYFKAEKRKLYKRFGIRIKNHSRYLLKNENPPHPFLLRIWWYIRLYSHDFFS